MTALETYGREIWKRLVAAGGFVFTDSSGAMTIHWNAGKRATPELAEELRRGKSALRAFVLWRHKMEDAGVAT